MRTTEEPDQGDIRYREATDADAPAMAELRSRSGWNGGASEERMRLYLRGEHHPQHAHRERVVFLAERGGRLIAFIAGHLTARFGLQGELQWLLVAPEARGLGVGDALWWLLRDWFVARGAVQVCVNVEPDNLHARELYRRHGGVDHSSHWLVWHDLGGAS